MFEFGNSQVKDMTRSHLGGSFDAFASVFPNAASVNTGLQFDSDIGLISFDDEVRTNAQHEVSRSTAGYRPNELRPVDRVALAVVIDGQRATERRVQRLDYRLVRHANAGVKRVANMQTVWFFPSGDADVAFAIEQSGGISNIHVSKLQGMNEKLAKSGEVRCPASNGAEGQSRTKQGRNAPGVRNEHGPTAEAKMCSELGRNVESPAEMTGPASETINYRLHKQVTECNTKYLFFRPHRERNFVAIGGDRTPVNQDAVVKFIGFAGNLTCSGRKFQAVLKA